MSDVTERFRAFLEDAPHWVDLLASVPAANVMRHDTVHPVFHGCIDWHSACHGIWALLAHRSLTGNDKFAPIVDELLRPEKLALEAADLQCRPEFEMPYGRAWFLRLALEDRLVTGSTRLTFVARDVAASLVRFYTERAPDPFAREYGNSCWALLNLLDYSRVEKNREHEDFVCEAAKTMVREVEKSPSPDDEGAWEDFMAVTHNFAELLVRTGVLAGTAVVEKLGSHLLSLRPIDRPRRAHHYALNFSRAWSLFALYDSTGDERLLESYLDHMEQTLKRPTWWRGNYRDVAHWVPQFGIFALQRGMSGR